ncbi:CamS family sex pheromone protein [Lactobacillus sp. PV037]|uniref:CamS family sex pheromone protein n=1 Tax=unclassified Lactobacillus TaxID=2620435 RepID=UPI00223EBB8E|nr:MULTISPECIES: CamS family sex pheromone protein [unclassified Lactobacillus]QNQ82671.1 CamS family sex pheromone protein [Lactobacillus sp. PV012]QNQ83212.1 CamS family sex pheromone protein [Lactobacillus sp. PV037]
MKKLLSFLVVLGTAVSLSACGSLKDTDLANNSTNTTVKKKGYQTTSASSNGYSVLLKNGEYVTSPIEGLTENSSDNSVDGRALEAGLMAISQGTFSPAKYVFQEGQEISSATATDWLARKSKNNPEGLNLKSTGTKNYTPIILDQILEQDYLVKSGTSYKVSGISLGLALNSVDYYNKVKNGAEYSKNISRAQQEKLGKNAANEIVARLRKRKALKNVTLIVGLFSKTDKDSLVGGNYFTYGIANANSSKIDKWKTVNNQSQVLPVVGNEKAINSNDATAFSDFKTAIEGYFPNISGVTATVKYQDGKLKQMNINVTTQFFGYAQIESFSRLVLSSAKKYLPKDAPIEIKIGSVNETQALIAKNSADDSYYTHIFGGE